MKEKKELRKIRFNQDSGSALAGGAPILNTVDALLRKKEEEEKKLARAAKFGIENAETAEIKRQ